MGSGEGRSVDCALAAAGVAAGLFPLFEERYIEYNITPTAKARTTISASSNSVFPFLFLMTDQRLLLL